MVDAEDIINNHTVGHKDKDLASLADLCDEVATGYSESATNEEENCSIGNISREDKGRKKAV